MEWVGSFTTVSQAAREVFEEIDDALGRSLTRVLFEGPEDDLRQTVNAQPGIMAVSLACVKAMEHELGADHMPEPVVMAGHSLGEYTALAVGGALNIDQTALLVQERGRLMQEACNRNPGTMAAIIGLDQVALQEVARETGVWISNVNTGEQIVISGERMAVAPRDGPLRGQGRQESHRPQGRWRVPLRSHGAGQGRTHRGD